MLTVRSIYKIGKGPSSSHSMAPARAARIFLQYLKVKPTHVKVILYGSLAATGKGHLTDNNSQIEYAAEMGLEYFPGHTCDPINGLVQFTLNQYTVHFL